jgi:hypothetical protein
VTRPITPRSQVLGHNRQTYVVCLDCGTELGYDLAAMRMGSPLSSSAPMPMPQTSAETGGPGASTLTTVPTESDRQIVSAAENKEETITVEQPQTGSAQQIGGLYH